MAQRDEVRFVLSNETDVEFRAALAKLEKDFPGWQIEGLAREEVTKGSTKVPVGVIKLKL